MRALSSYRADEDRLTVTGSWRTALVVAVLLSGGVGAGEDKGPASPADKVELVDGTLLEGLVVENGDNSISLEMGRGSRRIFKKDIARVEFDRSRRADARLEHDRVEFKSGQRIDGKVKLMEQGKKVRITLPVEDGKSPRSIVVPASEVRRIRWKSDLLGASGQYYTVELEKRIEDALKRLGSTDAAEAKKAEEFLAEAGVFAIEKVERDLEALAARTADGNALTSAGKARLEALRRLSRIYGVRRNVPDEIQEIAPDIYRVLHSGSLDEKDTLLKAILPSYPEASVDLALFVIRDESEAESLRALALDFLRRLQMNDVLLDLYNESSGQLKLAAAIALSRNRVLLGVPTLIEALSLDDEGIRAEAAKALRESTGQDFRFRAGGAPAAREAAVRRWTNWWNTNRVDIEKTALLVLRGDADASPEWKEATRLWKAAHAAWDEGKTKEAYRLLKQAVSTDPTFVKASISLAVFHYVELRNLDEAEAILTGLIERPVLTTSRRDDYWIHLELANLNRLRKRYGESLEHYEECLIIDSDSVPAVIGKADCEWLLATGDSALEPAERRDKLGACLEGYAKALSILEKSLENLVVLLKEDVPDFDSLPFERRVHNRSVLTVRKGYEAEVVRLHLKSAKVHSVLGRHNEAIDSLRDGLDYLASLRPDGTTKDLEAELRSYLGLTYERLGKELQALREYRRVLRGLDPDNAYCRQGVARLRRRSGR